MKRLYAIIIFMILLIGAQAKAEEGDAALGQWLTEEKTATVEVYKCGNLYCGRISWLKEPYKKDGTVKRDDKNPDEAKKMREILGMDMVWGFKYSGNYQWSDGKIYDPDNGKTYSCKMKLEGDTLKVRGYIGISLFGRTTIWTRKVQEQARGQEQR